MPAIYKKLLLSMLKFEHKPAPLTKAYLHSHRSMSATHSPHLIARRLLRPSAHSHPVAPNDRFAVAHSLPTPTHHPACTTRTSPSFSPSTIDLCVCAINDIGGSSLG